MKITVLAGLLISGKEGAGKQERGESRARGCVISDDSHFQISRVFPSKEG